MWVPTFQFHKGTIKTASRDNLLSCYRAFQFHKGTIKTFQPRTLDISVSYFNSIKVRLKPAEKRARSAALIFQFHKGTIKTFDIRSDNFSQPLFQFHKGTIKTYVSCHYWYIPIDFNSIKVRLKPGLNAGVIYGNGFQFHKGTIKTPSSSLSWNPSSKFQFHKGTIKT